VSSFLIFVSVESIASFAVPLVIYYYGCLGSKFVCQETICSVPLDNSRLTLLEEEQGDWRLGFFLQLNNIYLGCKKLFGVIKSCIIG
jgi:hypothetical protein